MSPAQSFSTSRRDFTQISDSTQVWKKSRRFPNLRGPGLPHKFERVPHKFGGTAETGANASQRIRRPLDFQSTWQVSDLPHGCLAPGAHVWREGPKFRRNHGNLQTCAGRGWRQSLAPRRPSLMPWRQSLKNQPKRTRLCLRPEPIAQAI